MLNQRTAGIGLVALIALLALGGIAAVSAQETMDATPRIAVMSAFSEELTLLLAAAEVEETVMYNGVEFTTGKLAGHDVVMFLSGVSMVNASMNTQLLLDKFNVTRIVYSGIAGGVNPELNIGDVAIPAQWGQYQEALYARRNADGTYSPPPWAQTPFENFGMIYPQWVTVRTNTNPDGERKFWFEVDPDMLATAESVAATVELKTCAEENVCLTHDPKVVVGGNGVSGQTFVDNAEFREYTFRVFGANVLDMETAASATVAYVNGVPFIAFRSLSDLAGGGPGENEISTFFQIAADNSAAVVLAFLNAWTGE